MTVNEKSENNINQTPIIRIDTPSTSNYIPPKSQPIVTSNQNQNNFNIHNQPTTSFTNSIPNQPTSNSQFISPELIKFHNKEKIQILNKDQNTKSRSFSNYSHSSQDNIDLRTREKTKSKSKNVKKKPTLKIHFYFTKSNSAGAISVRLLNSSSKWCC